MKAERAGRRLLRRIYLYGVLMIVLSAGASLAVGHYVIQPAFEVPIRPSTTWIAWHVAKLQDEPQRLQAELDDLRQSVGIEMTLFTPAGKQLITNSPEPPAPLTSEALVELKTQGTRFHSGRGRVAILDRAGKLENYVLVRYPQVSPFGMALGQLLVALIVLALLAAPLARSIALPVERLADLTRAFARGDFSKRAVDRQRQDEIGDLARAFDEMADRLAELRRTELELLANVSHELRTPLSRIRLALELVREGHVSRVDQHIEDIAEELVELEHLIDDVMTTARLDLAKDVSQDGLPPLHRQRVMGSELLEAAAQRFRKHHPERQLICDVEGPLPALLVDPVLLRRAIDNLTDNAAKFSGSDSVVSLRGTVTQDGLEISVGDQGMGIAAADQARVFEPFYRTDKSRTRATGGVGLGLALAKRIVEAHAGRIHFRSQPGIGSQFTIRLPAASEAPPSDATRASTDPSHATVAPTAPVRHSQNSLKPG